MILLGKFGFLRKELQLNVTQNGKNYLRRGHPLDYSELPTLTEVRALLDITPVDENPWNETSTTDGFRNHLEGWAPGGGVTFHNFGHVWAAGGSAVEGTMWFSDSPNDPSFWLHHCMVDRLWAIWQQKHPGEGWLPADGNASANAVGHRTSDSMALFATHIGTDYTVNSVLDHKAGGYQYDSDIPDVVLETPSVDFGSVPVGTTTYHAVRFRVESCRQVRFRIIAGPSGSFSQTPVMVFTAEPVAGEPFVYGYVFVAYTAPAGAGITDIGSVTIEAYFTDVEGFYTANPGDDYPLLTETIDLSASTVPVQKTAVALVLDRSGSMGGTATTSTGTPVTKVELLKDAVSVFSALMRPEDGVAVVSYDDLVARLLDVTEMGPYAPIAAGSGRDAINTILAGTNLDPRGMTGIGDGIQEGNSALADGQAAAAALSPPDPYDTLAMVVMTDGNENQMPTIDDVAASISTNTFAVGLGTAGNVSEAALEKIAKNNDGDLLVTGDMSSPVREFFLTKLFVQVLAGITNQDIILDPHGHLVLDAKHRIPFDVTEADIDVDIVVLSHFPMLLDFCLETPAGHLIQRGDAAAEPNIDYIEDRKTSFYRISLPALPAKSAGSHAGRWHAILKFDSKRIKELLEKQSREVFEFLRSKRGKLPYNLIAQTRSNLNMRASVTQNSHEPGARLDFDVVLTEYNQPVAGRANVSADVTLQDGSASSLSFREYEPGRFQASMPAAKAGVISFRVRASGRTLYGKPFTREQVLSAAVHLGGDTQPGTPHTDPHGAEDRLCQLLECIMSENILSPELEKRLNVLGIDIAVLRRCLKAYCKNKRTAHASLQEPGVTTKTVKPKGLPSLSVADLSALVQIDELKTVITELAVEREVKQPQAVVARIQEKPVVRKGPTEERINPIPKDGFYTKSQAKQSGESGTKKSD